ncbi:hypothetical protein ACH5RR_037836 [Cinchona calisaya]|uniref:Uncharacterized protein n=1 Tax=Cinchona calisaya TaxID=153742 RepID=A0ABD2YC11_9GENT
MLQHKFHRILSLMRNYVTNNLEDSASHQELWQEFDRIQRYLDDGMNIAEQGARDLTMLMVIENCPRYRSMGLQVVSSLGHELENVRRATILDADSLTGNLVMLSLKPENS